MAVPSSISFRDLNQWVEMHRVVSAPPSDTTTMLWGRIYPTSSTRADLVLHNGWDLDLFTNADWQLWYIVYAGLTWYFSIFDIIDGDRLLQIELRSTSSFGPPSASAFGIYNSDALAAAAGVTLGNFYIAGSGHDRADFGSLTTRLE